MPGLAESVYTVDRRPAVVGSPFAMNTPAHAVLNLLALGRRGREGADVVPILLGGVLPDVPMFVLYGVEKFVLLTPERIIWTQRYYDPAWQAVIDLGHSLPLILALLAVAIWRRSAWWKACLASMALHAPADLLLDNDDAHRHFFPVSDWRFVSPVSYWDSRHFGDIVAPLEKVAVVLALVLLIRRYNARPARTAIIAVAGAYAAYIVFVRWMWA